MSTESTIESIKSRWLETFSVPIPQQDVPKAAALARADIPKLLEMFVDQERRFEMLGFCLLAMLGRLGGSVEFPTEELVRKRLELVKAGKASFALTGVDIDEVRPGVTCIKLVHKPTITAAELEAIRVPQ